MSVESPYRLIQLEQQATPEADKTPEEIEGLMKSPWGSFNQLMVVKRHIREDGKMITKGVGVSIAYMPEVTSKMRENIMSETLGIKNPYVKRWAGEDRGEIFCMDRDLEEQPDVRGLIRNFIQVSGNVIAKDHPYKTHHRVERYMSVQQQRLDFASTAAQDGQRILDTPEFTGWSSMDPRYEGQGKVYIIEIYHEEGGPVYGSCPDGSMRPISEIPIDQPHQMWIDDGFIPIVIRPMLYPNGVRIAGNGENTGTVSACGNEEKEYSKPKCSDFFERMENGLNKISASVRKGSGKTKRVFTKMVDTFGATHHICAACKKTQENCQCSSLAVSE